MTESPNGATSVPPSDEPGAPQRKLDLSFSGLAAGSLAAITAAALGAKLGVAGTIIGAGVGSIVSAVAAAIFRVSLQDGHTRLRGAYDRAAQLRTHGGETAAGEPTLRLHTDDRPGSVDDRHPPIEVSEQPSETERAPLWKRVSASRWRLILVGAAVTFLVSIGLITAYEAIAGQTLSGDRDRTTISRIVDGGGDAGETDDAPTEAPQSPGAPASGTTAPPASPTERGSEPSETTRAPAPTTGQPEPRAPEPSAPAPAPAPPPAPEAPAVPDEG